MFVTRWKLATASLLAVAVAGLLTLPALAQKKEDREPGRSAPGRPAEPQEVRGVVRTMEASKNSLTVSIPSRSREAPQEKTFTLAKDAEVLLDDGRGSRFVMREGKLADVHPGALVTLTLTGDGKAVATLVAEGPTLQGVVKNVAADKPAITLTLAARGRGEDAEEKTLPVSKKAEIALDDGRGRRFSVKEGKLADVAPGSLATVKLSVDQKTVESIVATGPTVYGVVKSVDPGASTITLTSVRGRDEPEQKTYPVARDADVVLDGGLRGRGFVKVGKLADLPAGALASLKLAVDQKSAVVVRGEGPTVFGTLKGVDVGKGTVTVVVGAGRASEGEEKTFTLAKGGKVYAEGKEIKLADLKPAEGPLVSVKLSLDQKAVKSITLAGRRRE